MKLNSIEIDLHEGMGCFDEKCVVAMRPGMVVDYADLAAT
jgi:hypothetical protein